MGGGGGGGGVLVNQPTGLWTVIPRSKTA